MKKSGTPLTLNRCNEAECDLGVLFASNLKFSQHIKQITRKANSVIGIVKRSFSCLDKTIFRTLYVNLVRPHLEYASEIWNPYFDRRHTDSGKSTKVRYKIGTRIETSRVYR